MSAEIKYLSEQAKAFLAGFESRRAEVGSRSVPYLEIGTGEPLLIIHGFGGSKAQWRSMALELSAQNRVIVPDIPSLNTAYTQHEYTCDELVDWLSEFSAQLALDEFHVLSSSMGSTLAISFLENYPNRVKSLSMLSVLGLFSMDEVASQVSQSLEFYCPVTLEGVDRLIEHAFYKPPRLPKVIRKRLAKEGVQNRELCRKTAISFYEKSAEMLDRLDKIAVPSVFILGDHDKVTPKDAVEHYIFKLKNVQYYKVENAGHMSFIEKPKEVFHAYSAFQHYLKSEERSIKRNTP